MATIQNTYTSYINGTGAADLIYNYVPAYIHGHDGDDQIANAAPTAAINGDDDNDAIANYAANSMVYLEGGKGNDYVANMGSGTSTLYGGYDVNDYTDDNDILVGSPYATDVFVVGEYCGYDVIQNYDYNDIIFCATTSGYPPQPYVYGSDVIVEGYGMTVIVQGAAYKPYFNFGYMNAYGNIQFDTAQDGNLWGTRGVVATDGADELFAGRFDGSEMIFGAAQDDTINLYDATLNDIVATSVNENAVSVTFNTGETAIVATTENLSPTFKLASGESYVYNREAGSWQQK